jgi:L-rhamnose mutarotase
MEKFAFTMRLNPGCEEEYRRRYDAIWPELVDLLTMFHMP